MLLSKLLQIYQTIRRQWIPWKQIIAVLSLHLQAEEFGSGDESGMNQNQYESIIGGEYFFFYFKEWVIS